MRGVHKDMLQELESLKARLKELLNENLDELHRTEELLLDNERKLEDRVAKLNSFQTMREEIGKKFRKRVAHAVARQATKQTGEAGIASSVVGAAFSSPSGMAKSPRCEGQGKRSPSVSK